MEYREGLIRIKSDNFTGKSGPDNLKYLMKLLGDPQGSFLSIHVAGTNGKGSVCKMLSDTLTLMGIRTGLFTSPHLHTIRERAMIDGSPASEEAFLKAIEKVDIAAGQMVSEGRPYPTFFEIIFAVSMLIMKDENVSIAVLETGLGGRLDATNIVTPLVSVITSIGMDHMQYLGDTIEEIAYEKAGILKKGVPAVCFTGDEAADKVIEKVAFERGIPEVMMLGRSDIKGVSVTKEGLRFTADLSGVEESFCLGNYALYEVYNALEALKALDIIYPALMGSGITGRSPEEMRNAFRSAVRELSWPARMQFLRPDILLDGAHNEDAVRAFCESYELIRDHLGNPEIILLTAVSSDKDYRTMAGMIMKELKPDKIYVTRVRSDRALDENLLKSVYESFGAKDIYACPDIDEALNMAISGLGEGKLLIILGSLYLAGEIRGIE